LISRRGRKGEKTSDSSSGRRGKGIVVWGGVASFFSRRGKIKRRRGVGCPGGEGELMQAGASNVKRERVGKN